MGLALTRKMRHPPEPHYSFTIPSIHDDITLDCRVYHPNVLNKPTSQAVGGDAQWWKRGIVMAHPYAPMGGTYDDHVVTIVVDEFVKAGWIVGTFNFRGAHGSKGRTSWSGRPELDDYTSFAAFFVHYIYYLWPFSAPEAVFMPELSPVSPQTRPEISSQDRPAESSIMILGGYSYGSLILKHLPPVPTILQPFSVPLAGSAADEILMRARKLADQSNLEWSNLAREQERESRATQKGHEARLAVTMGGEETIPEKRRASRDIRRSLDGGLRVGLGNRLRSLSHRRCEDESTITLLEEYRASTALTMPETRYLLISPLTPPISTLVAPALGRKFWSKGMGSCQEAIETQPTLAIYGDQDIFTSAKRIRDWGEHLKAIPGSSFSSVEVSGAGHFWFESGVEEQLRTALRDWGAVVDCSRQQHDNP